MEALSSYMEDSLEEDIRLSSLEPVAADNECRATNQIEWLGLSVPRPTAIYDGANQFTAIFK